MKEKNISPFNQAMGIEETFFSLNCGADEGSRLAHGAGAVMGRGHCLGCLPVSCALVSGSSGLARAEQLGPAVFPELKIAPGISK